MKQLSHKCSLQVLHTTKRSRRSNNNLVAGTTNFVNYTQRTPADEHNACLEKISNFGRLSNRNSSTSKCYQLYRLVNLRPNFRKCSLKSKMDKLLPMTTVILTPLPLATLNNLCSDVYSILTTEHIKPDWVRQKVVLAPTSAAVNSFNCGFLSQQSSPELWNILVDTVTDFDQVTRFPTEFLYSQEHPGLPPREPHLKTGCLTILLCTLNAELDKLMETS